MDLSKMMKKQEPAQNEAQVDGQRLSKEEYAAMKKAEREDLWARVDAQAQAVFQDDAAMKGFPLPSSQRLQTRSPWSTTCPPSSSP